MIIFFGFSNSTILNLYSVFTSLKFNLPTNNWDTLGTANALTSEPSTGKTTFDLKLSHCLGIVFLLVPR